jgi:hypothetical protein
MDGSGAVIGTPDDAVERLVRLQQLSGGFGTGLASLVEGLGQDLIRPLPFTLVKGNHTFKQRPLHLAEKPFVYM